MYEKTTEYPQVVKEAVFAVKHCIDEHPLSRQAVPDLLQQSAVGYNRIRYAFREFMGCTIVHYQLQKRISEAAHYLLDGKYTIQQVANMCGYRKREANFSADFKKVYGVSPREWARIDALKNNTSMQLMS